MIGLLTGNYVLVITSRTEVGTYLGFPVYRVISMRFLSCSEGMKNSTAQEAYFMVLLKTVQSTPGLYFSYETDITLNFQRRCKLVEGWMDKPIWKQADPRFVWNRNLLDKLIEYKLPDCTAKAKGLICHTYDSLKEVYPASRYNLLEMIDCWTRMWRRGANLDGDVANFIETEQLVEIEGFQSSLLQIRGSIRLLWEQIVDLRYKPQLRIITHEQTSNVVERHFFNLSQRYEETMAVDLTDQHGDEGQLSTAFSAEMQNLPNVRYVSFDFHHVFGNSNFENLKVLYEQISEQFERQGYFLVDAKGNILEEQKGIVRSNCIDCLDRTNVTQSYLAQKSLDAQLQRTGVLDSFENISMFAEDYQTNI
ncbi:hypothetical protein ACFX16_010258 [Malus domestica]